MSKNISKIEEIRNKLKDNKIDLSKLEEEKIILFLIDSKDKNKEEIERLYLDKYNLNIKSSGVNKYRRIERYLGVKKSSGVNKWSKEKVELVKNNRVEELKKINIDYLDIINLYKEVKDKSKNKRNSNFLKINNLNF